MDGKTIADIESFKVKRFGAVIPPKTVLVTESFGRRKIYANTGGEERKLNLLLLPWTKANLVCLQERKHVIAGEYNLGLGINVVSNIVFNYDINMPVKKNGKPKPPSIAERWKGFIQDFGNNKIKKIIKYTLAAAAAVTAGVFIGPLIGMGVVAGGLAAFGGATFATAGYVTFARQGEQWAGDHAAASYLDTGRTVDLKDLEDTYVTCLKSYFASKGLDAIGQRPDIKDPAFASFHMKATIFEKNYGVKFAKAQATVVTPTDATKGVAEVQLKGKEEMSLGAVLATEGLNTAEISQIRVALAIYSYATVKAIIPTLVASVRVYKAGGMSNADIVASMLSVIAVEGEKIEPKKK